MTLNPLDRPFRFRRVRVVHRMDSSDRRWRVSRSSPVRADAEGLFIPVRDLAEATVGDLVIVSGPDGTDARTGIIAELTTGPDQPFYRVELDEG